MKDPDRAEAATSSVATGWPLVALLVGILAWSLVAHDTDVWLPDPWLPIAVAATTGWLASGALPGRWTAVVRAFAVVLPICAILGLEAWSAHRDAEIAASRMTRSGDRLLRYTYRPGAGLPDDVDGRQLRVNTHGMWDPPRNRDKPAGTLRIALLGDSVPNDSSVPFQARFHRALEASLNASPPTWLQGRRAEVLNFAVEGYNTTQEQRLYERHAAAFAPDLILWAYVLNDPFTQDGSYRRVGNSFFVHRLAFAAQLMTGASVCELFAPMYAARGFDVVVRNAFERMALLTAGKVPVRLLLLPIVADLSAPACGRLYAQVQRTAEEAGLTVHAMSDAWSGAGHEAFAKPGDEDDITHPNRKGHALIAKRLDTWLRGDPALARHFGEPTP
jgi:lysophospholipase L1-like esterase